MTSAKVAESDCSGSLPRTVSRGRTPRTVEHGTFADGREYGSVGKLTNNMWRLLGAQSSRNQSKSLTLIKKSGDHDSWAAELSDENFATEAEKLDITDPEGEDRARFLALVREAGDRALDMRPFDVQLQGALRLLEGDIIEMATGEGKTLAGAIAAIGYVLQGHRVHVVSVNDYLATRDAE